MTLAEQLINDYIVEATVKMDDALKGKKVKGTGFRNFVPENSQWEMTGHFKFGGAGRYYEYELMNPEGEKVWADSPAFE